VTSTCKVAAVAWADRHNKATELIKIVFIRNSSRSYKIGSCNLG